MLSFITQEYNYESALDGGYHILPRVKDFQFEIATRSINRSI